MTSYYPSVLDTAKVGTYPALVAAGGGLVWDEVLEYRVWCHPEHGTPDLYEGDDYFYAFDNFAGANSFLQTQAGAESPLALVLQKEYIEESTPGQYEHIKKERITEWPIEFLSRPRRSPSTIPNFLADGAPANRLAILRGEIKSKK